MKLLADKSKNENDNSHIYLQLPEKVACRYLKIRNIVVPDGNFAISGFWVFGIGNGNTPSEVNKIDVKRNPKDKRSVKLIWNKSKEATGYNISYGIDEDKMYNNYLIYKDTTVTINSLNVNYNYYFSIESFNENGITENGIVKMVN